MQNLWNDADAQKTLEHYAARGINEDLALRTYSSRLLGGDPRLVMHGGGNTSVKTVLTDVYGDQVPVVCVKGSGRNLGDIEPQGHPAVRLEPLFRLKALEQLSDEDMVNAFRQNLLDSAAPTPSVETLLHAYLPHKFIDHTHAVLSTVVANQPNGAALCQNIFGGRVAWVPYVMPGFSLSQVAMQAFEAQPDAQGLLLANHGIFSMASSARESYALMIEFITLLEDYIARHAELPTSFEPDVPPERVARLEDIVPILRGLYGRLRLPGQPTHWLFDARADGRRMTFVSGRGAHDYAQRGIATPEQVIWMKGKPAIVPTPQEGQLERWTEQAGAALSAYIEDYHAYFERNNARVGGIKKELDALPRVLLIPHLGMIGVGQSARQADISSDIAGAWSEAVMDAESIGHFAPIAESDQFDVEYWSLEQAKLGRAIPAPFAGQVVVVTGGGNGIGAATARAFAAQGAEVAVLDREGEAALAVASSLGRFALGLECDVTQPEGVARAFGALVTHFGGLDVVVSNAGIALGGKMVDLPLETLRQSFEVNFFGHQYVAQAAVRVLRAQGLGGALLFNVSKQAVNPGPDFGAYGTSKAALLALVRQYALEHGFEGIRVNAVNADRIRSGLLDDATIARRSQARGLSEAEYMAGNLLKLEVRAEDVAEAFVASALMARTTGNVVTVDGGNVAAMLR